MHKRLRSEPSPWPSPTPPHPQPNLKGSPTAASARAARTPGGIRCYPAGPRTAWDAGTAPSPPQADQGRAVPLLPPPTARLSTLTPAGAVVWLV